MQNITINETTRTNGCTTNYTLILKENILSCLNRATLAKYLTEEVVREITII